MDVIKISAFTAGAEGGNPAGIVLTDALPEDQVMQQIAADVGYSETAFAMPEEDGWRVRYFSPKSEVPFCGHATIALGAALASRFGSNTYKLTLNQAKITVDGRIDEQGLFAALQSPETHSHAAGEELISEALALFGYERDDLDRRIPPAIAHAGADHLILILKDRTKLAQMDYDLGIGRALMEREGLITIALVYIETPQTFSVRNAFASGGVLEDPATGAAAAAFAGYLRDLEWPHEGHISLKQGDDMDVPSRLLADFSNEPGSSIQVSGTARFIEL